MKHSIPLTITLALFATLPAVGANKPSASFIEEALQGNLWEVQVGQLAARKAADPEVRKFGATLNTDHGDAMRKASLAAQALGVKPPASLDAKHQSKYDQLSKLSAGGSTRRSSRR